MWLVTRAKHEQIIARELNPERRAFYELCWHLGGSQTDIAFLNAEDIHRRQRTVSHSPGKLRHLGVDPACICFGDELALVLRQLPQNGLLFPCLCLVRANDRATEFRQRCTGHGFLDLAAEPIARHFLKQFCVILPRHKLAYFHNPSWGQGGVSFDAGN
jgi:hypothetical protein